MIHSDKIIVQDLINLLNQYEIFDIVISPGSRNAPLTISFSNNASFNSYSIVDERSAAYVALGMSQQSNKATIICCTSGTALLNYYPAIAEAYYQNIPLIVISADRPKSLVNQGDGQTIQQSKALDLHCAMSVNLSEDSSEIGRWYNQRLISEALNASIENQQPVHINIPFSEPIYDKIELESQLKIKRIENTKLEVAIQTDELEKIGRIWNSSTKKIILIGSLSKGSILDSQLDKLLEDPSLIILCENTANIHHPKIIANIDRVIFSLSEVQLKELQADILITIGLNIISKKIKLFLRKFKAKHHWQIDGNKPIDTFYSLSKHIKVSPIMFISQLLWQSKPSLSEYQEKWLNWNSIKAEKHQLYLDNLKYSDLKIFESILCSFRDNEVVHFGNSSVIRYAQLFKNREDCTVFCNRGTSGIDGSSSTAIGSAMKTDRPVTMITGDVSFLYDSNALWNNYIPSSFRMVVLNNGGGNIFKFIPGPEKTGALETFFQTKHNLNAFHLAKMHGFDYLETNDLESSQQGLNWLYQPNDKPKILEINTMNIENAEILKAYFKALNS